MNFHQVRLQDFYLLCVILVLYSIFSLFCLSLSTPDRMSPTEFSNYIKQRQQLQQHNNHYHHQPNHHQNMFGAIGSVSPARSISPNPMAPLTQQQQQQTMTNDSMHQNPFVFPSNGFNLNMYQSFGSPRGMFDGNNGGSGNFNQFNGSNDPLLFTPGKCSSFMDQQSSFCKIPSQTQQQSSQSTMPASPQASSNLIASGGNGNGSLGTSATSNQQQSDNKLLDGINFYNNNANPSYQHLLVAN